MRPNNDAKERRRCVAYAMRCASKQCHATRHIINRPCSLEDTRLRSITDGILISRTLESLIILRVLIKADKGHFHVSVKLEVVWYIEVKAI